MIYNIFLTFFAISMAPKMLWQVWRKGKKVPSLRERFGMDPPTPPEGAARRIWVHAVSLGEMKAAEPLIREILLQDPTVAILVTTATATGFAEAEQQLPEQVSIRYFPLDFTWIMHRWFESFRPDLLIFVEGDIWPNLLREARRRHTKTALVSGKISEKSANRFRVFRKLARHLFSLDLLSVQNEEYRNRFEMFVDGPIEISGNLKLDIQPISIESTQIRRRFSLSAEERIIAITCTHAPEEKELLAALRPLWHTIPDLVIFLAPRHPERFGDVAQLLLQMRIPFCRWDGVRAQEPVVLVDAMGQLPSVYGVSSLAIVGGSFSSHSGGHNFVEPCLYGCPVLFGHSVHAQKEFAKIVIEAGAGQQVTIEQLAPKVIEWLDAHAFLRANALRLIEQHRGSAVRTAEMLYRS